MEIIPKNDLVYSDRDLDDREGKVIEDLKATNRTPIPDPDRWLDEEINKSVLVTTADAIINWGRQNSLWPVICFPACCAFEFIGAMGPRFDLSRFGMEILRASPREADVMITAGTLTWKMAPNVKRIYDQMAEPRWVIAMGACAVSGGIFRSSYNVVPGYNRIIPVDVYLPGCPPRPEALLSAIQLLQKKINKGTSIIKE